MAEQIVYPEGTKRWVKVARFLNVLDPQVNALSPTRMQAWAATGSSFVAIEHDMMATLSHDAISAGNAIATIGSVMWAHLAHKNYIDNKRADK
mgnify:CR=1 FL=1